MTDVVMTKSQGGAIGRGTYFVFTLMVMGIGWVIAAANAGISYLALGMDVIPIITGVIGCLIFVVLVRFLHCAWWLAAVSVLPAVFVLVGSVQYAPEAALDHRGVRETVRISDHSTAGSHSGHRFTLVGRTGKLKETLNYSGDHPQWKVGDRIEVVSDPEGVVPLEAASDVAPDTELRTLIMGGAGWTGVALLAGRRGFVRRTTGRRPAID
ncbi:hypothetical protein ACMA1D_09790 [Streptomyces sp. 796.1]|uniref:hypothetical protein n=1 Tax=Streptomyces sp. 796.1 TaxID=3163029 RepID=UPI0039C982FF